MTKQTQDALLMLLDAINDGSVISNYEDYHKFISDIVTTD